MPKRGLDEEVAISCLSSELEQFIKMAGAKSGAFSKELSEKLSQNLSDPKLRAILAHWNDLAGSLQESIFRQVSETIILQQFTK